MSGLGHLTQAVANPFGVLSSIATVAQNEQIRGQVAGIADHLNKVDFHKALRKIEDTMEKLAEAPFRKSEAGTIRVLEDVEEDLRSGFSELIDGARVVVSLEVLPSG